MPLRDVLMALAAVTAFGTSFVAIKVGVAHMPPLLATALRFLFAALPAVLVVARPAAPFHLVAAFGLALGVGLFGSMFVAIEMGMPAGLASIVVQLQVFLTIGLAWAMDGQRPHRMQLRGAVISALGMGLVGVERSAGTELTPLFMVLMAAGFWATANMVGKRAGNADRLALVVWGSLAAPLPLIALSLIVDGPAAIAAALTPPAWQAVVAVLFMAYPATVMAFSFWSLLLQRHPAALVAPFALLIPVVGMAASYVAFGETLTPLETAGAVLILAGLLLGLTAHAGGAGRGGISRV